MKSKNAARRRASASYSPLSVARTILGQGNHRERGRAKVGDVLATIDHAGEGLSPSGCLAAASSRVDKLAQVAKRSLDRLREKRRAREPIEFREKIGGPRVPGQAVARVAGGIAGGAGGEIDPVHIAARWREMGDEIATRGEGRGAKRGNRELWRGRLQAGLAGAVRRPAMTLQQTSQFDSASSAARRRRVLSRPGVPRVRRAPSRRALCQSRPRCRGRNPADD